MASLPVQVRDSLITKITVVIRSRARFFQDHQKKQNSKSLSV